MDRLVSFESVGVSLGGRPVLRGVDLTLDRGSVIGIVGPNGSGKTTLLRTIATLTSIDQGGGTVLGATLGTTGQSQVRRNIGFVGHNPALIGELSLRENLVHVARLSGVDESRIRHALEVVGLVRAADRRAEACSFGMRRRLEIAHLLLTKPQLLLLDEAAAGLDEAASGLVSALIDTVRGRGGGVVVVSHDRRHLDAMCDEVWELSGGALVR